MIFPKVVGFEGRLPTEVPFSWGQAAVLFGDEVRNLAVPRSCSREQARVLVQEGYLTEVPSIDVASHHAQGSLVVGALRLDSVFAGMLIRNDRESVGVTQTADHQIRVFPEAKFECYAERLVGLLLKDCVVGDRRERLQLGMILQSTNPQLLAEWVMLHKRAPHIEQIARAGLQSGDVPAFERVLNGWAT
jgi:hypothetical protein